MRSQKSARTKLVLRRWLRRILVLKVLLIVIAVLAGVSIYENARLLRVGGEVYRLRVADTVQERELGLSGVRQMSASKGMLFVFDEPDAACFWMKDMQFSLDMIWLDGNKRVIAVADDVAPRTYPRAYCPPTPATYVIELAAGQAELAGITPGQTLAF